MNLSRRNLLLGAVATAVAPALPTPIIVIEPKAWVPKPMSPDIADAMMMTFDRYYGGAVGGGKVNATINAAIDRIYCERLERIINPPLVS